MRLTRGVGRQRGASNRPGFSSGNPSRTFASHPPSDRLVPVEVLLRKVGAKSGRAVIGRLLRPPRRGSVVVIEFADGLHEYVTTPVKRVLRICGREIYYIQTANSRYRMEVRQQDEESAEQPLAQ